MPANETATATITNTYTCDTGSLKITKVVVGGGIKAAGKVYTFDVKGPDGYTNTMPITGSNSTTLDDVDTGYYTVTEQDANIADYILAVNGEGITTMTKDGNAEIEIINT